MRMAATMIEPDASRSRVKKNRLRRLTPWRRTCTHPARIARSSQRPSPLRSRAANARRRSSPRPRRAAQADDGPERSDQREQRRRNEERPGGVHAMLAREEEVAHLVRQQDGEQGPREGDPVPDGFRLCRRRQLRIGEQRTGHERRCGRHQEEKQVQERRAQTPQRAGSGPLDGQGRFTHPQLRSAAPMLPEGNRTNRCGPAVFAPPPGAGGPPPCDRACTARARCAGAGARHPRPT